MGLIRAAAGAVGGTLADSWLEYITAGDMGANTVMTKGVQIKRGKHGSNTKGTPDIISNGSRVEVGPNQMMILVDSGRIMDYTAEEGCYEVFLSSSPSMFNGQLKDSVRESFERFKFGGQPGKSQQVYFINLQEIRNIKFGTRNALQYFDNFYNAELFVRCHGSYSIKITDPLKFFMEVVPRNATSLTFDELGDQFNMEFLSALQSAIGQMSVDGVRISALPSKSMELSKYMATVLDEDWTQARGVDICAVGIGSISYDEESKALINMRNQGAMMGDPSVREGFVQSAVAKGLQAAGSNTAGAGQAYMAMGMGMQGAGNFMASASQTNAQQMQQQAMAQQQAAPAAAAANGWTCSCGTVNSSNFCTNCGSKKPAPAGSWKCSCGTENTGNFCTNCGNKKPAPAGEWTCSCGTVNTGNFCTNCGNKRG